MLGVMLALTSAACFAAQMTFTAASLQKMPAAAVLWVTTILNFAAVSAWAVIAGTGPPGPTACLNLVLAGLFAPLLGRAFQVVGLRELGSNVSTPILMTHPAITVVLAMAWLGERPSPSTVMGGGLVIAGSFIVGRHASARLGRVATTRSMSVLFPVFGALTYGVSMIFRKIALTAGADPATAASATIAPSGIAYTGYFAFTGQFKAFTCNRAGIPALLASSFFASIAALLWFVAAKSAPLAVIAPLAATTPVFALLLAFIFLRRTERFSRTIVLGTAASVAGVALTIFGAT